MAQTDLVSLETLASWLGIRTLDPQRDADLSRLITQISRAILNTLNRPSILPRTISDTFDGNGRSRMVLKHWPVYSVDSVVIDGVALSSSDYTFEQPDAEPPGRPQMLKLKNGRVFTGGDENVTVTYSAGYKTSESQTVPSDLVVRVSCPYGPWASDVSVSVGGLPLAAAAAAPSSGQYSVSADGRYTFHSSAAGQQTTIVYGYTPADLTQAALEWCAYRWAAKDRVGQTSKSLGGQETVSYTNEAVPTFVASALQNFKRIC